MSLSSGEVFSSLKNTKNRRSSVQPISRDQSHQSSQDSSSVNPAAPRRNISQPKSASQPSRSSSAGGPSHTYPQSSHRQPPGPNQPLTGVPVSISSQTRSGVSYKQIALSPASASPGLAASETSPDVTSHSTSEAAKQMSLEPPSSECSIIIPCNTNAASPSVMQRANIGEISVNTQHENMLQNNEFLHPAAGLAASSGSSSSSWEVVSSARRKASSKPLLARLPSPPPSPSPPTPTRSPHPSLESERRRPQNRFQSLSSEEESESEEEPIGDDEERALRLRTSRVQPTSLAEIQLPHLQIFPVNHSQQTRKSQLQMLPHCSSRINNQQSSPSSPHLRLPIKA